MFVNEQLVVHTVCIDHSGRLWRPGTLCFTGWFRHTCCTFMLAHYVLISVVQTAEESKAVLLVDASNAFNFLNHQMALLNIKTLCPPLATTFINTYQDTTELFVDGTFHSREGAIQGDPLAMPMYAIAILPLVEWCADDTMAIGHITALRSW